MIYNVACKATYCVVNNKPIEIFKDPKTVTGTPKKSHRGLIMVELVTTPENPIPHFAVRDRVTAEEEASEANQLKTVFEDGKLVIEYTLAEIRETRRKAVHAIVSAQFQPSK